VGLCDIRRRAALQLGVDFQSQLNQFGFPFMNTCGNHQWKDKSRVRISLGLPPLHDDDFPLYKLPPMIPFGHPNVLPLTSQAVITTQALPPGRGVSLKSPDVIPPLALDENLPGQATDVTELGDEKATTTRRRYAGPCHVLARVTFPSISNLF
jgi:hypothetical protein